MDSPNKAPTCRLDEVLDDLPPTPREALLQIAQTFFDFATTNTARHQLMNER